MDGEGRVSHQLYDVGEHTAFSGALITPTANARSTAPTALTAPIANTIPAAQRAGRGAAAYRTRTCAPSGSDA